MFAEDFSYRNPQYNLKYAGRCKLCGCRSYNQYCRLCEYTLFQIDHIIQLYLQETPPENMDNAIAEFDRIYYSNVRLRVFYNSACEVVNYVKDSPDSSFELSEPNFSVIPTPKVVSILEESGLVVTQNDKLYAGELLKKLAHLRLSGYALSSEEFQKQLRIIYAILTLKLTKTLLNHEEYIPQVVTGIFRAISAHLIMYMDSDTVPRRISQSSWRSGFKRITPREVYHMEWDLLGLTPNTSPRIFSDYDSNKEQFISKECMTYYYEYMRDRIRERERERQR